MSHLLHFLTGLATNPYQQAVFFNNPNTLIDKAGFSEEEKIWLKIGDKEKLSAAFTDELTVLATGCVDPGDDPMPDPDPSLILSWAKAIH